MNYKQLRISPEAHFILLDFAKKSKVSLIDAIDKIAVYIVNNKLVYGDLLRKDAKETSFSNLEKRIEYSISILRDIETKKLDQVIKAINRIETDTTMIVSNMQINQEIEEQEKVEPQEQIISPLPVRDDDDLIYQLKVDKETSDLRLTEAIQIMKLLIKDPASTSSGRKKSLREEDFELVEKFIKKCTLL